MWAAIWAVIKWIAAIVYAIIAWAVVHYIAAAVIGVVLMVAAIWLSEQDFWGHDMLAGLAYTIGTIFIIGGTYGALFGGTLGFGVSEVFTALGLTGVSLLILPFSWPAALGMEVASALWLWF